MIISIIVAVSENNAIGLDGSVPWHLTDDLKNFKRITMGHHLIVGRKTYDSIGRPLPGREMIIISRNEEYSAEGCVVSHSLEDALELARNQGDEEAFIAGGAEIYALALPLAHKLYYTKVDTTVEADTFFPAYDSSRWEEIERVNYSEGDGNDYNFMVISYNKVMPD